MKLAEPTDFQILTTLDEHGRNTAQNVSLILDKDRGYVNTRLPHLAEHNLVERVGPAKNSGLYEITPKGSLVLEHRDRYEELKEDFVEFIERELAALD